MRAARVPPSRSGKLRKKGEESLGRGRKKPPLRAHPGEGRKKSRKIEVLCLPRAVSSTESFGAYPASVGFSGVVMSGVSELPSLLFRQRLILAVLAGAVALRDAVLGTAFFLLLLAVSGKSDIRRTALSGLFFLLGLGITFLASPKAPDCPSWA